MAVGSIYAGTPVTAISVQVGNDKTVTASSMPPRTVCDVWLSDTALGAPSANPPNGGTYVTSGSRLTGLANDVSWSIMADSTGVIAMKLVDSETPTFYVNISAGGRTPVASSVVVFA